LGARIEDAVSGPAISHFKNSIEAQLGDMIRGYVTIFPRKGQLALVPDADGDAKAGKEVMRKTC
jgi:hypothetical protein